MTPMRTRAVLSLLIAVFFGASLGGCQASAPKATSMRISPGAYAATFQAVKDELRASGFELDRIDARAGIITTRPHFSAGLATPWVRDESTFGQEVDGFLNRHRRTVIVRFAPSDGESSSDPPVDRRLLDVEIRASVEVRVERIHRLGLRPSSSSIRLSSVAEHGEYADASEPLWTTTTVNDDELLAARIVGGVTHRVQQH